MRLPSSPKDKKSGLPKKYVPRSLSPRDRAAQIKSIREGSPRPKVKSYRPRGSRYTSCAHAYFGRDTSLAAISRKTGASVRAMGLILRKGRGAYRSSGSRPNQTAESWARARLYSVLFGGKARQVDQAIVDKFNLPLLRCE